MTDNQGPKNGEGMPNGLDNTVGLSLRFNWLPVLLIILTARKIMRKRIEMGPVSLWGTRAKLAGIRRIASYALRQRATHFSDYPSSSTVLDLHDGKGAQRFHAGKLATSSC
jgi:hypothetical protein